LQKIRQIKNVIVGTPPRELEAYKCHQLWGPVASVPVGYEYKCAKGKDKTTFHFLVSKGWNVEMYTVKSKDQCCVKTAFLVPAWRETIEKWQKHKLQERLHVSEEKIKRMDKKMNKDTRFNWGSWPCQILGGLVAFHPKVSSLAWEQIWVLSNYAFSHELCPVQEMSTIQQVASISA
jgi:hypothetical protein